MKKILTPNGRIIKKQYLLAFLLGGLPLHTVVAAGFDCTNSSLNETEKKICDTSYLSRTDSLINEMYSAKSASSISQGTLKRDQVKWLRERNLCGGDANCIELSYRNRKQQLDSTLGFLSVEQIFKNEIDPPLDENIVNKNGFVIKDNPWKVRKLFSRSEVSHELNLSSGSDDPRAWQIMTYKVVNGDLVLFFAVTTQNSIKIIMYRNDKASVFTTHDYNRGLKNAKDISLISQDPTSFTYSMAPGVDYLDDSTEFFKVNIINGFISQPIKTEVLDEASRTEAKWVGHCGRHSCIGNSVSPDKKWRIATPYLSYENSDEGIYFFPENNPDLGVNVFMPQTDNNDREYGYNRNFTWGEENTFYFDNDGGLACIWKSNIEKKITERILPVEGLIKPFYVNYSSHPYVISSHENYSSIDNESNRLDGYFIAKN
ncbi:hypothetical protein CWS43_21120 [Rahnella sp. AA]|uniref:lysozyme inhibitor LprI family protein n=1 Tax=Rahnella sp. AA TaxID=2057180 RepID=UPI000C31E599|nr:hypothetical protein [Rahnella sp. AA]PKE28535.1 hypothetical protein CWS43_21120 [Rahnella sp. AA]